MKTSMYVTGTFVLTLAFGTVLMAQEGSSAPPPTQPQAQDQVLSSTTVEGIMTQAVKNIARRYNLNDEQMQYTDRMMKERVTKFLKDHEREVWPIIRELLASGLQAPQDAETRKRIGAAARPLAELAREEIFKANYEWREILTDDQRALHDFDLKEMELQFEMIDKNFVDWSEGKATDQGVFPPPPREMGAPPRPQRPGPGLTHPKSPPKASLPEPVHATVDIGIFEAIVEQFIKDYELDEGQRDSARSILAEFKGKAAAYKESKKEEFAKAAADQKDALAKADREAIARASRAQEELVAPLHSYLEQMDVRLKGLLTTAQIEKYEKVASAKGAKKAPRQPTPIKPPATAPPPQPGGGNPGSPNTHPPAESEPKTEAPKNSD